MNKKLRIRTFLQILPAILTIHLSAAEADSVSALYTGSHGYLLQSSTQKVALDALIYWEGSNYGYIKPPEVAKQMMESAKSPFDSLNLILIGHGHSDHFNPEIIESAMLKSPKAILVASPEVVNVIESAVDSFSYYSDRIWAPELEILESADTVISDIPLTITCVEHDGTWNLFVFSFVLDNIRFLHLNGFNPLTNDDLDTLAFNRERADVAFLCYNNIMNGLKFSQLRNYIHPVFSTIGHVDGATTSKLNGIEAKIEENLAEYPMNMMSASMEQMLYIKTNDTILVDTLNSAPRFLETIPNQEIMINQAFSFTLPANLVSDSDSDEFDLSVSAANNTPLPEWLTYDETHQILSGTPVATGTTVVYITATDTNHASRQTSFRIIVSEPDGVFAAKNELFTIYPQPASNTLCFNVPEDAGSVRSIRIFDEEGRTVLHAEKSESNSLSVESVRSGLYFLNIVCEDAVFTKKVLIKQ